MIDKATSVQAVAVTFNPDLAVLSSLLIALAQQVDRIFIVDNASSQPFSSMLFEVTNSAKFHFIQMPDNMGLGAAQNIGIQHARAAGASHVLILDQDSQPSPDMISYLLDASKKLQADGVWLAAVAPAYSDSSTGVQSGFVRLGWLDFQRQEVLPGQNIVEADFAISSGSLIPIGSIDNIGPMDETLFIDHVDTEWCLRAQSKGYKLFGVPAARMLHTLGDRRTRIWFLRWRNVPYHSPFRYYYILRNSLLMQRRSYMPLKWRVAEAFRCIRLICFFGLAHPQRGQVIVLMLKGLWHGLRGVSGKLPA